MNDEHVDEDRTNENPRHGATRRVVESPFTCFCGKHVKAGEDRLRRAGATNLSRQPNTGANGAPMPTCDYVDAAGTKCGGEAAFDVFYTRVTILTQETLEREAALMRAYADLGNLARSIAWAHKRQDPSIVRRLRTQREKLILDARLLETELNEAFLEDGLRSRKGHA